MKKIIALFLALLMVCTIVISTTAAGANLEAAQNGALSGDNVVFLKGDADKIFDGQTTSAVSGLAFSAAEIVLIQNKICTSDTAVVADITWDYSININASEFVILLYKEDISMIGLPSKIELFSSADGSSYTSLGEAAIPSDAADNSIVEVKKTLDTPVSASYFKAAFTFGKNPAGTAATDGKQTWEFFGLTEISVYSVPKTESNPYESKAASSAEPEASKPAAKMETITVDGDISDDGWAKDGWTTVDGDSVGIWQTAGGQGLTYKYQVRSDDANLYIAYKTNKAPKFVEDYSVKQQAGSTNMRIWIDTDLSTPAARTQLIDLYFVDDEAAVSIARCDGVESTNVNVACTKGSDSYTGEVAIPLSALGINSSSEIGVIFTLSDTEAKEVTNEEDGTTALAYDALHSIKYSNTDNVDAPWTTTAGYTKYVVSAIALKEIPADESDAEGTSSTGGGSIGTGDTGVVAMIILAVISLAGVAIIRKRA